MSSPVAFLHTIVEVDPTPLTIPPRPIAAALVTDVELQEMPGRLWTYRAISGGFTLGFVRHSPDDVWVARTLGSENEASSVKRFSNRTAAVAWLRRRLDADGRCAP
jgi:hypothetical protein